jgi:uncharacterized protein YdbL (DUF1318 family)
MKSLVRSLSVVLGAALAACVTVNVYFPAAAVEQAADKIVREIYGTRLEQKLQERETPPQPEPAPAKDKSGNLVLPPPAPLAGLILEWMVPAAHAQAPDIDINTPAINQLKAAMQGRHQQLIPFYNAGAVGMAANGLLVLRDPKAVSLKDRNALAAIIAAENSDRNVLYTEIATANGHPEWEREIRTIFDRRWVANAPGGWWFQNANGGWMQK